MFSIILLYNYLNQLSDIYWLVEVTNLWNPLITINLLAYKVQFAEENIIFIFGIHTVRTYHLIRLPINTSKIILDHPYSVPKTNNTTSFSAKIYSSQKTLIHAMKLAYQTSKVILTSSMIGKITENVLIPPERVPRCLQYTYNSKLKYNRELGTVASLEIYIKWAESFVSGYFINYCVRDLCHFDIVTVTCNTRYIGESSEICSSSRIFSNLHSSIIIIESLVKKWTSSGGSKENGYNSKVFKKIQETS